MVYHLDVRVDRLGQHRDRDLDLVKRLVCIVAGEGELIVLEIHSHFNSLSVFELLEGEVDYLAIDQGLVALETQLDDALLFPDILLTLFGLAQQPDPNKSLSYLIDPHLNVYNILSSDRVTA